MNYDLCYRKRKFEYSENGSGYGEYRLDTEAYSETTMNGGEIRTSAKLERVYLGRPNLDRSDGGGRVRVPTQSLSGHTWDTCSLIEVMAAVVVRESRTGDRGIRGAEVL